MVVYCNRFTGKFTLARVTDADERGWLTGIEHLNALGEELVFEDVHSPVQQDYGIVHKPHVDVEAVIVGELFHFKSIESAVSYLKRFRTDEEGV